MKRTLLALINLVSPFWATAQTHKAELPIDEFFKFQTDISWSISNYSPMGRSKFEFSWLPSFSYFHEFSTKENIGLQYGISLKSAEFGWETDTSTHCRKFTGISLPLVYRYGLKDMKMGIVLGFELNYFYCMKSTDWNGEKKRISRVWFSKNVNAIQPNFFAGISNNFHTLKVSLYPRNLFVHQEYGSQLFTISYGFKPIGIGVILAILASLWHSYVT